MSNKYFNFTAQKISPETKEKVQLQILLHDGSANTFHFNNPLGRETAINDRNTVKELLLRLAAEQGFLRVLQFPPPIKVTAII
jgi:transcription initiation factor TFIIH subunit 1